MFNRKPVQQQMYIAVKTL